MFKSFIETQFPVSKISKESYKERKAVGGQTLTGLGKWWGRKPLILVRAILLGLLMPSSNNPKRDREIFLKILTMDDVGLWLRKNKKLPLKLLLQLANEKQRNKYFKDGKWQDWVSAKDQLSLEKEIFMELNWDEKLSYCSRPENIAGPSNESWIEINSYLNTNAGNLSELVQLLGEKLFKHVPRVGDAFAGGGSIPFESARLGCDVYASDLNPAAAMLTWSSLNLVGDEDLNKKIVDIQEKVFSKAEHQLRIWGIEHNEKEWLADAYLYCTEAKSPATGYWIPLSPSWVISERYKVCAVLRPDDKNERYHIDIKVNASESMMAEAKKGTFQGSELVCPKTNQRFSITSLRGDKKVNGSMIYGLRHWENRDIVPRPEDIFQERLYCIRYIDKNGERHYVSPDENDIKREEKVLSLLKGFFTQWQKEGFIPSSPIPKDGDKTEEPIRTRGWTYWHHLFNPRQLLVQGLLKSLFSNAQIDQVICALFSARAADWNSKLSVWLPSQSGGNGGGKNTFLNQALNPLMNYSVRGLAGLKSLIISPASDINFKKREVKVITQDARSVEAVNDFWITDPPYADAINYHELGDFFIAWYKQQIPKIFPDWYNQNKAALAVKGKGKSFNESMVDCYSNFTAHMPENGAQVVMFTHQDAGVWADLALILWASGLQVTSAWTIQTETDAVGIKTGNYVQGTVCMVLRKQRSEEVAFLSDIQADVEYEVKNELKKMMELDDKEDPNFGDTDYQLAAYVAALRVITGYKMIQDIDVKYELSKEKKPGEVSEVQKIIDSAVTVACEYLVPTGFDSGVWRLLSGDERFYIKALEIQSHGEFRSGVFHELARGFGIRDYKSFLKSGKANETRLMTAIEFGNKQLKETGFGSTLVRHILFAIRETNKDENPKTGRMWLYHELPDYWGSRQKIIKVLSHIIRYCSHVEYWKKDIQAAHILCGYIENDTL